MKFRRAEKRLIQRVAPPFNLRPIFNLLRIPNFSKLINPGSTDVASFIVVNYRWNLAIAAYVPLIGKSNRKALVKQVVRLQKYDLHLVTGEITGIAPGIKILLGRAVVNDHCRLIVVEL